jgi:hypothetical protein
MSSPASATASAIRPFTANVANDSLADLRRRIAATRWPSKELVADRSQGVQLATLQERTLEEPAGLEEYGRFGTVRPRAQIPGPRPTASDVVRNRRSTVEDAPA